MCFIGIPFTICPFPMFDLQVGHTASQIYFKLPFQKFFPKQKKMFEIRVARVIMLYKRLYFNCSELITYLDKTHCLNSVLQGYNIFLEHYCRKIRFYTTINFIGTNIVPTKRGE